MLPESFDFVMFVSILGNETLLGNVIYKTCIIKIVCRKLSVDLITLDMRDFYVILGMN